MRDVEGRHDASTGKAVMPVAWLGATWQTRCDHEDGHAVRAAGIEPIEGRASQSPQVRLPLRGPAPAPGALFSTFGISRWRYRSPPHRLPDALTECFRKHVSERAPAPLRAQTALDEAPGARRQLLDWHVR